MSPRTILVVDDDADSASVLARLLRRDGYEVRVAISMAEASHCAVAWRPDFLISDVKLTDGDGCELLRRVRRVYPVRAIAVTGYVGEPFEQQCRDAGYERVLAKPFRFEQVQAAIEFQLPAAPGRVSTPQPAGA